MYNFNSALHSVISFNGQDIPKFIRVSAIDYSVLPELTASQINIPKRFGGVDGGVSFGAKVFKVKFNLVPTEEDLNFNKAIPDLVDEFVTWLKGDDWQPSKLIFGEQPDKYFIARCSNSVEVADMVFLGQGEIEFTAINPIKYDLADREVVVNGDLFTLQYLGNVKSYPTIEMTVDSNCTTIEIRSVGKKDWIELVGTFQAGDKIVIDNDYRKIFKNGQLYMESFNFYSNWLYLEYGNNAFIIDSGSTMSGVVVKYKNQYL